MTIEAELADGTVLEFPDGTSPDVIKAVVKQRMSNQVNQPQQTREQIVAETAARNEKLKQDYRKSHPVLSGVADFAQGMGSTFRNVVNTALPEQYEIGKNPLADENSAMGVVGQIADPASAAIGAGAGKAVQMGNLLKKPILQSIAGGALGGGVIGSISDDGSAATGAAIGGAVSTVVPLAGKLVGKGVDLFKGGISDNRTRGILKSLGLDSPEAVAALEKATPGLNVAQVINSPTQPKIAALQRYAQEFQGTTAWNQLQAQKAAREAAMSKVAGGSTSETSQASQVKAVDTINKMLEPMRNRTLSLADKSGKLKTDTIIDGIDDILGRSDIMRGGLKDELLTQLKGMLGKNTDEFGVIKADALHSFRKEEINNEIQKLLKNPDDSIKTQAAKVTAEVRDLIDESINNASGGKMWSNYLGQYSKLKQSVNKMKMADLLRSGTDDQLIKTASGQNPALVTEVLGRPSAGGTSGFAGQMGKQSAPFQQAQKELSRDRMLSDQVPLGAHDVEQAVKDFTFAHKIPNFLNPKVTATNMALKGMDKFLNAKTIEKLSKAMYSPQETLRILNSLPAGERNMLLKAMQDSTNVTTAAGMMTGANQ